MHSGGVKSIFLNIWREKKTKTNLFKDKFLSSPYNHPNPHSNPKMWFTRRSSQCCSGWESTLRTSQEAQNSLKRGNGWGWGSFFCSQRTSPSDIDQVKTVLTCGAHSVTVLPSFPSLVYFKNHITGNLAATCFRKLPLPLPQVQIVCKGTAHSTEHSEGTQKVLSSYQRQVIQRKKTTIDN